MKAMFKVVKNFFEETAKLFTDFTEWLIDRLRSKTPGVQPGAVFI
jgi:hypothetical protein